MHCTLRHGLAALALLVAAAPAAASCWSAGDKADLAFDELQGETRLSFRDAVSCQPLAGAQVEVGGRSLRADALGEVRLDTRGMTDRRLPLTVRVDGYPEYTTELEIALGGALRKRFAISRRIDIDGLRFVLTWEAQPRDLDLHLEGPGFHVSYRDMRHHAGPARPRRAGRLRTGDDHPGPGRRRIALRPLRGQLLPRRADRSAGPGRHLRPGPALRGGIPAGDAPGAGGGGAHRERADRTPAVTPHAYSHSISWYTC